MAIAELSPCYYYKTKLNPLQLSSLSSRFRNQFKFSIKSLPPVSRASATTISCNLAPNQVQTVVPVKTGVQNDKPECYGVFCLTYDLKAVWQEFWITGDVDGRGDPISNPNGPLDHDLFLLCARDTVKLLRNHASLALWVGGNEQIPPEDINAALKHDLRLSDNSYANGVLMEKVILMSDTDPSQYLDGTRVYVQRSMWDGFADGKGNFTDGPYEIQNPEDFFNDSYYKYGFNPDVALLLNPSMSS